MDCSGNWGFVGFVKVIGDKFELFVLFYIVILFDLEFCYV